MDIKSEPKPPLIDQERIGLGLQFYKPGKKSTMIKSSKFLFKFLAAIAAILFVLSSTLVMALMNLGNQLFNSGSYIKAFRDLHLYEKMPGIASITLTNIITDKNLGSSKLLLPSYITNLPPEDLESILGDALTPGIVQEMTESTLEGFFSYLNGDAAYFSVAMSGVKDNLFIILTDTTLIRLLSSQPPCNQDEITAINSGPTVETTPFCHPPDELLESHVSYFRTQINSTIKRIPDIYIFTMAAQSTTCPFEKAFCWNILPDIRLMLRYLGWLPTVPLFFFLGIAALAIRSVMSLLRWWGIPLFFSGLLGLIAGMALRLVPPAALKMVLGYQNPSFLTPELAIVIHQLAVYLFNQLTKLIILPASIMLLLGLAAWIISGFIHDKAGKPASLLNEKHQEAE